MSAPTAELLQITISPEEVFGQMPKDSLAALMHPDRNELRISMLNLEQEIAQYVAYKLKSTTHTSPTTFAHPDYTDLSLSAYATDFTDGRFQITKTNINRGNDTRLLQAAAPIVHYAIQAQQPAGEGRVQADRNGNVYRQDNNGSWQQRNNNNWQSTDRQSPSAGQMDRQQTGSNRSQTRESNYNNQMNRGGGMQRRPAGGSMGGGGRRR